MFGDKIAPSTSNTLITDGSCGEPTHQGDDEFEASEDSSQNSLSLNVPKPTKITYLDFNDPFSLVDHASGAPHVSRFSSLAWVGCGGDVYVLDCLTEGFIRIEPEVDNPNGTWLELDTFRFNCCSRNL
jgi:hypothetical protein